MAASCLYLFPPDYSVHDFGDLDFHHFEKDEPYMDVKSPRNVGAANKMLSGAVSRAVGAGHTLVMLGGDHRYTEAPVHQFTSVLKLMIGLLCEDTSSPCI